MRHDFSDSNQTHFPMTDGECACTHVQARATAARTPASNEVAPGATNDTNGPQNGSDAANDRPAKGDQ